MMVVDFTMVPLATIALCILIALVRYYVKHWRFYKLGWTLPGPFACPLIGTKTMFLLRSEDYLPKLSEIFKAYPSFYRLWSGPRELIVVISDPDFIKSVLATQRIVQKPELIRSFLKPSFGTGLFTASAEKWQLHRKLIDSIMDSTGLRSFVFSFVQQAEELTKDLEELEDGPEFDVHNYTTGCALRLTFDTILGMKTRDPASLNREYKECLEIADRTLTTRIRHSWLQSETIFSLLPLSGKQKSDVRYIKDYTANIIRKKIATRGKTNAAHRRANGLPEVEKQDLLNLLIGLMDDKKQSNSDELVDQTNTLMTLALSTLSMTMTCSMMMIASHPDVQAKISEELDQIYKNEDRSLTESDLSKMVYLERVIQETLRLFPAVPLITRGAVQDVKIGDHAVPSGATIFLSLFALHRDAKWWPDPLKFDPDRFLPEEVDKRHPYAYLPFSTGPRDCIGSKYAILAIKVLLATILRKYILRQDHIIPVGDIKLKMGVAMSPAQKMSVRIEKRMRNSF